MGEREMAWPALVTPPRALIERGAVRRNLATLTF